jgi:hypothetical protein
MHHAIAHKGCLVQSGDHPENSSLFTPFKVCLKANHIVERGGQVILSQL